MAFTYTHTYTREELQMKRLNEIVYILINDAIKNGDGSLIYRKLDENNSVKDEIPTDDYDAGVLIGDNFQIRKRKGLTYFNGRNIVFGYKDATGIIYSVGDKYGDSFICLNTSNKIKLSDIKSEERIKLTDFPNHPEAAVFLSNVLDRLEALKIDKEEKQVIKR